MAASLNRVSHHGAFKKLLRQLDRSRVLIGVPAENAGRDDGLSNALIGYRNEFGDPEQNLPARPHLIPAVQSYGPEIAKRMGEGAARAFAAVTKDAGGSDKAAKEVEATLHAVGLIGQNAVRAEITDANFTPLAPRTIQQRGTKGRTGDKPLIDTGEYRRSHTYSVRLGK